MVTQVLPLTQLGSWHKQPSTCRNCPLYGIGQGFVPPCMPDDRTRIRLAIQGEAPGKQEVQQRLPFVGPAGFWLTNNILNPIGVTRDEVVFDNTLRCMPPRNKAGEWYPVGGVREMAEVECRQYDIWHALPHDVPLLLAGGKALKQRLGHQSISGWHGHIQQHEGRLVGCTFHPSAVMRQPNLLPVVVREAYNLLLAQQNPALLQPPTIVRGGILPDRPGPMVFDLEWNERKQITCVGVAYDANTAYSTYGNEGAAMVKDRVADGRLVIGHNILDADFPVLGISSVSCVARVFDTKVAAHLAHPHLANLGLLDLGSLVRFYRPTTNWKQDTQDVLVYNGRDCAYNFYLYERLVEDLTTMGVMHLLEKQQRLAHMARLMHEPGIAIDHAAIIAYHEEWSANKGKVKATFPFNPNSPKQVIAHFNALDIKLKDTKEATIERMADRHPLLQRLADYKGLGMKPITTWFPLEGDMIYPRFNATGTDVARFSCADPNCQNIPPSLRRMIVPRPGTVLVSFDFSQIENRCIASLAGDHTMLADFTSGMDFHTLSASRIFNKPYEEVAPNERYEGKRTIHATNYGETAAHLAERLFGNRTRPSVERARWLQAAYFSAYPAINVWQQAVSHQLESGELGLRNPFGRLRYIYARDVHERMKRGCHFLGCSAAADIVNQCALDVWEELARLPLLVVHDELVYEMAPQLVDAMAPQIKSIMERPVAEMGGLVVPVKMKVGCNYGELQEE